MYPSPIQPDLEISQDASHVFNAGSHSQYVVLSQQLNEELYIPILTGVKVKLDVEEHTSALLGILFGMHRLWTQD